MWVCHLVATTRPWGYIIPMADDPNLTLMLILAAPPVALGLVVLLDWLLTRLGKRKA